MLIVVADYRAQPGTGDLVADGLARHVAAIRREPGCVDFVAGRDHDDPDHFVLYERYLDDAAFQAHRRTPHFATYIEGQIAPLLVQRTWHRFTEVAGLERSDG